MNFAGFPANIVLGGTSLVTTLPAPIDEPSPIFDPGKRIAWAPILTLLPICTFSACPECGLWESCFEYEKASSDIVYELAVDQCFFSK